MINERDADFWGVLMKAPWPERNKFVTGFETFANGSRKWFHHVPCGEKVKWKSSLSSLSSPSCLSLLSPRSMSLRLSVCLCHGFSLPVMYNHRGLERYQACEDLSPLCSMRRLLLKCEHDVFTTEHWTIRWIGDPFWFLWQYQIEISSA